MSEQEEPRHLSPRVLEIVRWMADGKTTQDIAEILGRSRYTITSHIEQARLRTGASNATALVAMALRKKWIE